MRVLVWPTAAALLIAVGLLSVPAANAQVQSPSPGLIHASRAACFYTSASSKAHQKSGSFAPAVAAGTTRSRASAAADARTTCQPIKADSPRISGSARTGRQVRPGP
jgi:hypothetical protein